MKIAFLKRNQTPGREGTALMVVAALMAGVVIGGAAVSFWAQEETVEQESIRTSVEVDTKAKLASIQQELAKKKESEALAAADAAAKKAADDAAAQAAADAAAAAKQTQTTTTKKTDSHKSYEKKPFASFNVDASGASLVSDALFGGSYAGTCTLSLKHIPTMTYQSENNAADPDGCHFTSPTISSLQSGEWKASMSFYSNDGKNKFYSDYEYFTL